jgi:hypothetical protein
MNSMDLTTKLSIWKKRRAAERCLHMRLVLQRGDCRLGLFFAVKTVLLG